MAKKLYIANHKISGLRQSGVDLPTLQLNRAYELEEAIARDHVESGALRQVENSREETEGTPIPEDFPSYDDLVGEKRERLHSKLLRI